LALTPLKWKVDFRTDKCIGSGKQSQNALSEAALRGKVVAAGAGI